MIALLLPILLTAGVDVDLRGQSEAAGVAASINWTDKLSLTAGGSRLFAGSWDYQGRAQSLFAIGSVKLGPQITAGSVFDGRMVARIGKNASKLTLNLGYQHLAGALSAEDRPSLILGRGILGSARLETLLGPVTVYAQARAAYAFPVRAPASPVVVPPDPTTHQCQPTTTPTPTPANLPPGAVGNAERGFLAGLQQIAVAPGVGLSVPIRSGIGVYAEGEVVPTLGIQLTGGVTLTFDHLFEPRPKPVAEPVVPPAEPVLSSVELRLASFGKPVAGTLLVTGPRRLELPVPETGSVKLKLESGKWRIAFHAPGHLARESEIDLQDGGPALVEADLAPVPDKPEVIKTADGIRFLRPVEFLPSTASLTHESLALLDELADIATDDPERSVLVVVHVDQGEAGEAIARSEAQARAVRSYLAERVAASRIRAIGAGDAEPIAPNILPESRKLNRRVVITLQ